MRAEVEVYKGIEFVRISNLPAEQKEKISNTFPKDKVIKILKDEYVLNDCIQYRDYVEWFSQYHKARITANKSAETVPATSLKFSVK